MREFDGRIAVVTGGGTGMGRELVVKLTTLGCRVATCDVSEENMAETRRLALEAVPDAQVLTVRADVGVEADMEAFRDAVVAGFDTDHINLLLNNAGIGGGGSFVEGDRDQWERTFGVCWYGVYYGCRVFMPLLVASQEGYVVNTSSVNGFWASLGPGIPHTSYSAAKFAVKGFTEALINDLRVNAPHVRCAVVMPGHIGTSIAINSGKILGSVSPLEMSAEEVAEVRNQWVAMGVPVGNETDDQIRRAVHQRQIDFRDNAPTSAAQAADIILDGVKNERWRILVGEDAGVIDEIVCEEPEAAYEPEFLTKVQLRGHFQGVGAGNQPSS